MNDQSSFEIRKISAEATLSIRRLVLRSHEFNLENCRNPEDDQPSTFHFGAFHQGNVIGVASFQEEAFPNLKARSAYRLRGMATLASHQQRGVGRLLLRTGIEELQNRGCDLLWCKARQIAFLFYERLGLLTVEPLFDIPGIGPHKVMYKYLS